MAEPRTHTQIIKSSWKNIMFYNRHCDYDKLFMVNPFITSDIQWCLFSCVCVRVMAVCRRLMSDVARNNNSILHLTYEMLVFDGIFYVAGISLSAVWHHVQSFRSDFGLLHLTCEHISKTYQSTPSSINCHFYSIVWCAIARLQFLFFPSIFLVHLVISQSRWTSHSRGMQLLVIIIISTNSKRHYKQAAKYVRISNKFSPFPHSCHHYNAEKRWLRPNSMQSFEWMESHRV